MHTWGGGVCYICIHGEGVSVIYAYMGRGCPYSVVANILDCDIVGSKFKLQLCSYIHFWTNALGKGMNPFIITSYELNSTTTILLQGSTPSLSLLPGPL